MTLHIQKSKGIRKGFLSSGTVYIPFNVHFNCSFNFESCDCKAVGGGMLNLFLHCHCLPVIVINEGNVSPFLGSPLRWIKYAIIQHCGFLAVCQFSSKEKMNPVLCYYFRGSYLWSSCVIQHQNNLTGLKSQKQQLHELMPGGQGVVP